MYELAYTYSSFRIDEVISNRINETEQEIIIFEKQAYDETQNQIVHIAGYEKMQEGNTYLLYLQATENNHYVPLSAVIGKVPLNRSEIQNGSSLFRNNDDNGEDAIAALHGQIQDRYQAKIDGNNS